MKQAERLLMKLTESSFAKTWWISSFFVMKTINRAGALIMASIFSLVILKSGITRPFILRYNENLCQQCVQTSQSGLYSCTVVRHT